MTEIDELLEKLLGQTNETATVEFKREITLSSDIERREFAKDVSALANTDGGYILYGKEDRKEGGRILGINSETFDADQMQQVIATRCYPPVRFNAKLVKKDKKWFVLLEIPESDLKPHEIIQKREVWIRRGGTTDRATQREREQMSRERAKSEEAKREIPLKEQLEREGIREEPGSWSKRLLTEVGRWYMQRVYGSLDVSLFKEKTLLIFLGLLCFSPIAYWFYQIYSIKETPALWLSVLSVILAFAGVILFSVLRTIESLRCPSCRRYFAIRRFEHIRVREREIDRSDKYIKKEITYRDAYRCEFCDYHERPKFATVTETLDRI